ncbi:MAG: glycosyltransferase [Herminiimonas sp.]|nr:glycosyltransferase [Herminiimonas sp.]
MTADSLSGRNRVLVLTSTFPRWEGDREPPFVFELSRRLAKQFDVVVLAPHAPGAKTREQFGGIDVHRFRYCFPRMQRLAYDGGILANLKRNRFNYLLVPLFTAAEFISLIRLLRQSRIDAIHAHWLIPQGLVALAARLFSIEKPVIVCTSHGGDLFGLSGPLLSAVKRAIIRRVDKLTVVSHAMADYAATLADRHDLEVIPMGVDLAHRFTPLPERASAPDEILFAGRLVEKKGVRYLILAMPMIVQRRPQVTLLIAGEGPEREELEKLAFATGVAGHIRFLGAIENRDLRTLYRRAAVFVAPSVVARGGDQEGLGLVFVEALGCGCAVVASDLPAIRDVIIDGVTGLICKQKDSADLGRKVLTLLDDPIQRAKLGAAGRRHVADRFDWEIVAERYRQLIDALLQRQPASP